MSAVLKDFIRNGRVGAAEPIDRPEGTEVVVTSRADAAAEPVPPKEIARVSVAPRRLRRTAAATVS